jgi:ParB-like chromosome segregation protein Spo0J
VPTTPATPREPESQPTRPRRPAEARIHPEIAHLAVPISSLRMYEGNPRRGNLAVIAESLTENGQYKPLVVNKGTLTGRPDEILAGNNTYLAAVSLEWESLAVTYIDVDDERARKVLLVDNKANDASGYDHEQLAAILAEIGQQNLVGTGFSIAETEKIIEAAQIPPEIDLPSVGAGTGTTGRADVLEWGYVGWSRTRVQITGDEVAALDAKLKAYVSQTSSDVGFGFALAGDAADEDDPDGRAD